MRRNQIAKLPQYAEFGCGWFGVSFDHLCRVAELKGHANHFFFCFSQIPMGWLWIARLPSASQYLRNMQLPGLGFSGFLTFRRDRHCGLCGLAPKKKIL